MIRAYYLAHKVSPPNKGIHMKKAFLFIITAGILWGTSGIFVHFLAPYGITSLQMTSARAIVSLICVFLYALFKKREAFSVKPAYLLLFLGIGASLFLTASCYYSSMQMTSVSTAVVLMYAAPIYVMVYSVAFLGEKLTKIKAVSVICMLIGCCLISGIVGGLKFDPLGVLIGVFSGISYAAYNVLTKIAMQKGISPTSTVLYGFSFMALISLVGLDPKGLSESVSIESAVTIPLLIALGICTFVIPYVLYTLAMKDLSAGSASALSIIEPMSATIFSVILFDEKLSVFSVIGIVLILGAVYLMGKYEDK